MVRLWQDGIFGMLVNRRLLKSYRNIISMQSVPARFTHSVGLPLLGKIGELMPTPDLKAGRSRTRTGAAPGAQMDNAD